MDDAGNGAHATWFLTNQRESTLSLRDKTAGPSPPPCTAVRQLRELRFFPPYCLCILATGDHVGASAMPRLRHGSAPILNLVSARAQRPGIRRSGKLPCALACLALR
jgi:hypothetical protein